MTCRYFASSRRGHVANTTSTSTSISIRASVASALERLVEFHPFCQPLDLARENGLLAFLLVFIVTSSNTCGTATSAALGSLSCAIN